jgi:hypothetical protein
LFAVYRGYVFVMHKQSATESNETARGSGSFSCYAIF